jgi:predicted membrane protein
MKMQTGLVLGILFIIIGILILLKIFLPFNLPIFKILIGLFVIYLGVRIITGRPLFWKSKQSYSYNSDNGSTVFSETSVDFENIKDRNSVVFGKTTYDFTNQKLDSVSKAIKIDVAFGSADILVSKNSPVIIQGTSAFGSIDFPNGNSISFGTLNYVGGGYKSAEPHLAIKLDVAFGGATIIEK